MKLRFLIILPGMILIMLNACAGTGPAGESSNPALSTETGPASSSSLSGTYFAINDVGLGQNGYVSLTNYTDVPASLDGLYLCQGSDCFKLPEVVVGAGETVRVAVGNGKGLEGVIATHATLGELRPGDGEIALFMGGDFEDPGAMTVYFQWGSTPHELTQRAIEAGLWVEGGYGPSSQNAIRVYRVPESGLWLFEE